MASGKKKLNRDQFVLAVMSAADGASHQPVQVQKLLFLVDDKIGSRLGGPFFNFKPYDYGPFDSDVYRVLEHLEAQGLVEIVRGGFARRSYRLTPSGQQAGDRVLASLAAGSREYIKTLSNWVRSLSFAELVSAVYKAYPQMQVNSVFVGC